MSRYIRREKANFLLTSVSPHVRKFKTGFWTPRHGFRIPGTGFWIPCHWNLDSGFQWFAEFRVPRAELRNPKAIILDSTSKNLPHCRFQKQEFVRFRNPDSLTWGDLSFTWRDLWLTWGDLSFTRGDLSLKTLCISSLLDSFLLPWGKLPNPPKHSAKY